MRASFLLVFRQDAFLRQDRIQRRRHAHFTISVYIN